MNNFKPVYEEAKNIMHKIESGNNVFGSILSFLNKTRGIQYKDISKFTKISKYTLTNGKAIADRQAVWDIQNELHRNALLRMFYIEHDKVMEEWKEFEDVLHLDYVFPSKMKKGNNEVNI